MEQAGQYAIHSSGFTRQATILGGALWYIAQRVLAILALLAFIYGLLAAEVELAKIEQVTDQVVRW